MTPFKANRGCASQQQYRELSPPMSTTRGFVDFLATVFKGGLTADARDAATDLITDGIAVAALGSQEAGPAIFAKLACESGSTPTATLIGHQQRVAPADAARANGAAMHVLDYEPMWNPANHALSTALPAVIACTEMILRRHPSTPATAPSPDGPTFLAALAIAVETQARIRLASGQYDPGKLVFHPPGIVGPLGSAVACGLLFGLDSSRLTHAVGIAASRAGTIQANAGSMTKALHCGQAAASGLESALLAAHGFTADADALSGPRGYGHAFFGDGFEPQRLTERFVDWHIVKPGPAFKFYPSQYGTHFVITAALDARRQMPAGAHITSIRIVGPSMPYVDRPVPATGLAGKFSFQYTAAAALLDGTVGVESFTDARRFAPDMSDLLQRIRIEDDAAREGRFDRLRIDVHVEVSGGQVYSGVCAGPPGIWGNPADRAMLLRKAQDCLSKVAGADTAEHVITMTRQLGEANQAGLLAYLDGLSSLN